MTVASHPRQLSFASHKVLKDGSWIVVRIDLPDRSVICKIIKGDAEKLRREVTRIEALRETFPTLAQLMPAIIGQGHLRGCMPEGRPYYLQEFVGGTTLGDALQQGGEIATEAQAMLGPILRTLLDHVDEHRAIEMADPRQWLFSSLAGALDRLKDLPVIDTLARASSILINGRRRDGLAACLARLLPIAEATLPADAITVAALGHWNFHAQNLILTGEKPAGFAIIDPDSSLDSCDPMFGIARLLYSFPHDVAEQGGYRLVTDHLLRDEMPNPRFEVEFGWIHTAIAAYGALYHGLFAPGQLPRAVDLDRRLADPAQALRLHLNLLLCLMRGAAVNHEADFQVVDGNLRHLRNNGVFLYLHAVDLANTLLDTCRERP
ncbi:MAG: phosphotransferase [Alphaproteobacteria bacterium]|nr:phosphotransferase [Alphaproteobacteria bacterium]